MTIAKYLGFLGTEERTTASLLKAQVGDLRRDPGGPNSVIRSWQITFDHIMAAARAMLDEHHNPLQQNLRDHNTYTLGRIGRQ